MATIEKDYAELREKMKLPEYGELDREFDLSSIEPNGNVLRSVREKISDKLAASADLLDHTLQPDVNLSSLYESRIFTEEDKKEIFNLYRALMSLKRKCDALQIMNSDEDDRKFISGSLAEWKKVKPMLVDILSRLEASWKKEAEPSVSLPYFG